MKCPNQDLGAPAEFTVVPEGSIPPDAGDGIPVAQSNIKGGRVIWQNRASILAETANDILLRINTTGNPADIAFTED